MFRYVLCFFALGTTVNADIVPASSYGTQSFGLSSQSGSSNTLVFSVAESDLTRDPMLITADYVCSFIFGDVFAVKADFSRATILIEEHEGSVAEYKADPVLNWTELSETPLIYGLSFDMDAISYVIGTRPNTERLKPSYCFVRMVGPTAQAGENDTGLIPGNTDEVLRTVTYLEGPTTGQPVEAQPVVNFDPTVINPSKGIAPVGMNAGLISRFVCAGRTDSGVTGYNTSEDRGAIRSGSDPNYNKNGEANVTISLFGIEEKDDPISFAYPNGFPNSQVDAFYKVGRYQNCQTTLDVVVGPYVGVEPNTSFVSSPAKYIGNDALDLAYGPTTGQTTPEWIKLTNLPDASEARMPSFVDVIYTCAHRGDANQLGGNRASAVIYPDNSSSVSNSGRLKWDDRELQFAVNRYENCLLQVTQTVATG
ncbi:MAG: hypothetical protein AAGF71_13900 [Pseudomonadota bacterium]